MSRDFGPYRLGPIDLLIAVNALRFAIVPICSRIFWIAVSLIFPIVAVTNAIASNWIGALIFIGLSVLFLVIGPMLSGWRRRSVVLRVTDNGLLAITDEAENLYKAIDVERMRLLFGRLLIPVNKQCVLIAPAHAIGQSGLVELEARIRQYAASHQPAA